MYSLKFLFKLLSILILALASHIAHAEVGRIYPHPDNPYPGFRANNLSFEIPNKSFTRAESEPFYAILLKSATRCTFTEKERLAIQGYFPNHKVFYSNACGVENYEDLVEYTNYDSNYDFIAVYGGVTLKDAKRFLKFVKNRSQFKNANIRKMRVIATTP